MSIRMFDVERLLFGQFGCIRTDLKCLSVHMTSSCEIFDYDVIHIKDDEEYSDYICKLGWEWSKLQLPKEEDIKAISITDLLKYIDVNYIIEKISLKESSKYRGKTEMHLECRFK